MCDLGWVVVVGGVVVVVVAAREVGSNKEQCAYHSFILFF